MPRAALPLWRVPPRGHKPAANAAPYGLRGIAAAGPPLPAKSRAARRCSFFFFAFWGCSSCSGFLLLLVRSRVLSWLRSLLPLLWSLVARVFGRSSSFSAAGRVGRRLFSAAGRVRSVPGCCRASAGLCAGVGLCGGPLCLLVFFARLRGSSRLRCRASGFAGLLVVLALLLVCSPVLLPVLLLSVGSSLCRRRRSAAEVACRVGRFGGLRGFCGTVSADCASGGRGLA